MHSSSIGFFEEALAFDGDPLSQSLVSAMSGTKGELGGVLFVWALLTSYAFPQLRSVVDGVAELRTDADEGDNGETIVESVQIRKECTFRE